MHSVTTSVSPGNKEYSAAEKDTTSLDMTMPRKRHRRRLYPESADQGTVVSKEFIITVKETKKRETHPNRRDEFLKPDTLVSVAQKTKEEKSAVSV